MNEKAFLLLPGLTPSVWCYELQSREQTLGRSHECDVRLMHETVSRRHAVIWGEPGAYFVRDLESSNGTFIDGEKTTQARIEPGKRIRVGDVLLDMIGISEYESNTAVIELRPTEPIKGGLTAQLTKWLSDLSEAQVRVLRLLLKGLSEKEAAASLNLSPHTVHTHVKNIYRLLGVRTRGQLMAHVFAQAAADSD
jgi:DNA-binding CsgD family transcriptional regulator